MKEKIDFVNRAFIECFKEKNYEREGSVEISSGIDDSVTYIGSGISVLKPLLVNEKISNNGHFIKQKAIRTQSLKKIYDTDSIGEFSSFFDALCVLAKFENSKKLVNDSFDFFQNYLDVLPEDIMIRINSNDKDLIELTQGLNPKIKREFDTRAEKYYKHKYGLDEQGIFGRNFNFAFKDKITGEYKDVGNIIILESDKKKYGIELALGVQPAVMRMNSLPTSLHASYIADIVNLDSPEKIKYAESLVAIANLQKENLMGRKHKSRYPVYLYKKYLKALKYWKDELNISKVELMTNLDDYLRLEYNPEFEFTREDKLQQEKNKGFERDD